MAPRSTPTERQRRLGTELRRLRDKANMTTPEAAKALNTTRSGISNIEAGRFGVSSERVRALARIYSCGDQALIDALAAMATERGKGWWEEYREIIPAGALTVAELEHHASAIRSVQILHAPGLLQTEDYAKNILGAIAPPATPIEIRRRTSFRMRRREFLDKDGAPSCTFLIHEVALRMQFGGPKVMKGQLEHLLESAERDNVTIRAIPIAAGSFPSSGVSAFYAHGPVPQLDTVHLDVPFGSSLLDAETHLTNFRTMLDTMEAQAATVEETQDLMSEIARKL